MKVEKNLNKNSRVVTGTEILNFKHTLEDVWLLENYFPANVISALTGASDCGKSTFLRQLAISIVCGKEDFLGNRLLAKHNRVIYVSSEDNEIGTKMSLAKQARELECKNLDNFIFLFDSDNLEGDLQAIINQNPVDLVIIDTWSDNFQGNSNSFTDVRADLEKYKALNCSVILLHHNVKHSEKSSPDKNKLNGSQGIEAKLRALIELRIGAAPDERLMTILKSNYIPHEMKQKSKILKLSSGLVFHSTEGIIDFSRVDSAKQKKYDPEVWIPILNKKRENGKSISIAVNEIKQEYNGKDVPSETWFKENYKLKQSVAN
jgi:hypothetical protein